MPLPTSSGTLGTTEEHRDLRDAVRAFVKRHVTETVVRDAATGAAVPWACLAVMQVGNISPSDDASVLDTWLARTPF